jgi:hypothetical protein
MKSILFCKALFWIGAKDDKTTLISTKKKQNRVYGYQDPASGHTRCFRIP